MYFSDEAEQAVIVDPAGVFHIFGVAGEVVFLRPGADVVDGDDEQECGALCSGPRHAGEAEERDEEEEAVGHLRDILWVFGQAERAGTEQAAIGEV